MNCYSIILGGGSGKRMGAPVNKVLLPLCGIPVLIRSIVPFTAICKGCIVVVAPGETETVENLLRRYHLGDFVRKVVTGGAERQDSVRNGFLALPEDAECVLIHDGARPLVSEETIKACIQSAERYGSGIAAIPSTDTVKIAGQDGLVLSTPPRQQVYAMQTPQAIQASLFRQAMNAAAEDGYLGTDDASLLEHAHIPVHLSEGRRENIKLTTPTDWLLAEAILKNNQQEEDAPMMRIGHGYDVHRLTEGRKLILCGVEIPYERGLLGHSDADVAVHALMDAMIGALALGDIGKWFPDHDDRYLGADSTELLRAVCKETALRGWKIENADITISAQKPKLRPYIESMRVRLSQVMNLSPDQINIKATTTEGLGFEGEGLGISAQAVCLLSRMKL